MKKGLIYLLVGLIFLSVVSCDKKDAVTSVFPGRVQKLNSIETISLNGMGLENALFISQYGEWFIFRLFDLNEEKEMLAFYNPALEIVFKGAPSGTGSSELTSISSYVIEKNILYLFGPTEKRFIKVDIDESIAAREVKVYEATEMGVIDLFNITRVYPVEGGFIGNQYTAGPSWYSLYGNDNIELSSVSYTNFDVIKNMTYQQKSSIHMQSYVTIKPDKKRVAVAGLVFGAISFSEIDGRTLNEYKRYEFAPPVIENSASQMVYTSDEKRFFTPIVSNDESIISLYRGINRDAYFSHTYDLLRFNWEGEPVCHYRLDQAITDVIMGSEPGTIWGLMREPDLKMLKYNL